MNRYKIMSRTYKEKKKHLFGNTLSVVSEKQNQEKKKGLQTPVETSCSL